MIEQGDTKNTGGLSAIQKEEISVSIRQALSRLHESQRMSFDTQVGYEPTKRELAEKAIRIEIGITELPDGKEGDKQLQWAKDFLNNLQQSSAGLALFGELSKKVVAELKEEDEIKSKSQI